MVRIAKICTISQSTTVNYADSQKVEDNALLM